MYDVVWTQTVLTKVRKFPKRIREDIGFAVYELQLNPTRHGTEKMGGAELYRYRTGEYRILYTIHHEKVYIHIVAVGHRGDVYR